MRPRLRAREHRTPPRRKGKPGPRPSRPAPPAQPPAAGQHPRSRNAYRLDLDKGTTPAQPPGTLDRPPLPEPPGRGLDVPCGGLGPDAPPPGLRFGALAPDLGLIVPAPGFGVRALVAGLGLVVPLACVPEGCAAGCVDAPCDGLTWPRSASSTCCIAARALGRSRPVRRASSWGRPVECKNWLSMDWPPISRPSNSASGAPPPIAATPCACVPSGPAAPRSMPATRCWPPLSLSLIHI